MKEHAHKDTHTQLTHMHTHKHTHAHTHTQTHKRCQEAIQQQMIDLEEAVGSTHTRTNKYTHIHTRAHTLTRTHTHTHTLTGAGGDGENSGTSQRAGGHRCAGTERIIKLPETTFSAGKTVFLFSHPTTPHRSGRMWQSGSVGRG